MENSLPSNNYYHQMQPPVGLVLGTLIMLAVLGAGFAAFFSTILGTFMDVDVMHMQNNLSADMNARERAFLRGMLLFNHLFMFIFSGVLALWLFCRRSSHRALRFGMFDETPAAYIKSQKWPDGGVVLMAILMLIVSLPFVHYLHNLNKMLPLPEWAVSMENQTNEAIKGILKMASPLELVANLIVMALIPAVGEELVFRGIVQQQVQRVVGQPWLAIVLAGAIFSAFHFQFEGFLPRWCLGCLLGWLFWQTQNFWVPVLAHFFNNAFQVVGQYLFLEKITALDFEQDLEVPVGWSFISFILILVSGWLIKKLSVSV